MADDSHGASDATTSAPSARTDVADAGRPRRKLLFLAIFATVAALTFASTALLVTIFEHKQESRTPFVRLVDVDEFNEATELFEAVWYGNADTGEEEEKRLRNLGQQVLAAAGGR